MNLECISRQGMVGEVSSTEGLCPPPLGKLKKTKHPSDFIQSELSCDCVHGIFKAKNMYFKGSVLSVSLRNFTKQMLANDIAAPSPVANLTSADVTLVTDGRDCSFKETYISPSYKKIVSQR